MRTPRAVVVATTVLVGAVVVASCGLATSSAPTATGSSIAGYRVVGDLPLPGNRSRWDYQSLDPSSHRLYIAHLGADEIVVFDVKARKVVGVARNVPAVHGVLAVPEINRLFATATGSRQLAAIDIHSLQVVATAPAGQYPDRLDYVPELGKVFVTDEQGTGEVVIDAPSMKNIGSVELGADAGNTKYDPVSKLIYVAVGSSNELVAIDPKTASVVQTTSLSGCQGAHGVQLSASPHRAFVACEATSAVVVFDFATSRQMGLISVGSTPDVMAYDPGIRRVYVACEDGTLAVIEAGADPPSKLSMGNAGPNAHSVAVDPSTHLPLADVDGHPVLRVLSP